MQTEDSDYFVNYEYGFIEFKHDTGKWKPKIVKITTTGGYTADSEGVLNVPDDIKSACIQQVSYLFKRRDDLGLSGASTPDGNLSYAKAIQLLPNVKDLLEPHVLIGGEL